MNWKDVLEHPRVLPGASAFGTVLAAVSGLCISATAGSARAWWIAGAISGVVLSATATYFQASRLASARAIAVAARTDRQVEMNDILDPLVLLLGEIIAEPSVANRRAQQQAMIRAALAGVVGLIGPDRVRACWFDLTESGGRRRLTPSAHAGRAGAPRTTFVEGTDAGDAALALIDENRGRYCPDVGSVPPPGWNAKARKEYRTFVSVPAIAGSTGYGMLSIDALKPGDLLPQDESLLRLMAGLLADGLAR